MTSNAMMVYATFPNLEEAQRISSRLVECRLAACANLFPGMISVYQWKGNIEQAQEIAMVAKTTTDQVDALIAQLTAEHSYETPAVVAWPIAKGAKDYMDWISAETRP